MLNCKILPLRIRSQRPNTLSSQRMSNVFFLPPNALVPVVVNEQKKKKRYQDGGLTYTVLSPVYEGKKEKERWNALTFTSTVACHD